MRLLPLSKEYVNGRDVFYKNISLYKPVTVKEPLETASFEDNFYYSHQFLTDGVIKTEGIAKRNGVLSKIEGKQGDPIIHSYDFNVVIDLESVHTIDDIFLNLANFEVVPIEDDFITELKGHNKSAEVYISENGIDYKLYGDCNFEAGLGVDDFLYDKFLVRTEKDEKLVGEVKARYIKVQNFELNSTLTRASLSEIAVYGTDSIGDSLIYPNMDFKRVDLEKDLNINYKGGKFAEIEDYYNNFKDTTHNDVPVNGWSWNLNRYVQGKPYSFKFTFKGTKFRLIGGNSVKANTKVRVVIDGKLVDTFNPSESHNTSLYKDAKVAYMSDIRPFTLLYGKELEKGEHEVEVLLEYLGTEPAEGDDSSFFFLQAIDVDLNAEIIPNKVFVGDELQRPQVNWNGFTKDDTSIKYVGQWKTTSILSTEVKTSKGLANTLDFRFTGTSIRIIGARNASGSSDIDVFIDGKPYKMSCYSETEDINTLLLDVKVPELPTNDPIALPIHTLKIVNNNDNSLYFLGVHTEGVDSSIYLDTNLQVGDVSLRPDYGYKRFYSDNKKVSYIGNWTEVPSNIDPNHSNMVLGDGETLGTIKFKFYGTKLRIIANRLTNGADNVKISIDNSLTEEFTTMHNVSQQRVIVYENTALSKAVHIVAIEVTKTPFIIEAIDVDSVDLIEGDHNLFDYVITPQLASTDHNLRVKSTLDYTIPASKPSTGNELFKLNITPSSLYREGINFETSKDFPHVKRFTGGKHVYFRIVHSGTANKTQGYTETIIHNKLDNLSGALVDIPKDKYSIQIVTMSLSGEIYIVMGQEKVFDSLQEAQDAVANYEPYLFGLEYFTLPIGTLIVRSSGSALNWLNVMEVPPKILAKYNIRAGSSSGSGGAAIDETLDDYYNKQEMQGLLSGKADLVHNHNNLYYTKSEVQSMIENVSIDFLSAEQVVETNTRKFLNATQIDALSGIKDNVQTKINEFTQKFSESMFYKGKFKTNADMVKTLVNPANGWTATVEIDETQENVTTLYMYHTVNKGWFVIAKGGGGSAGGGFEVTTTGKPPTNQKLLWIDAIDPDKVYFKYHNGTEWRLITTKIASTDVSGQFPASKIDEGEDRKFISTTQKDILTNFTDENGVLNYRGVPFATLDGAVKLVIDDSEPKTDRSYSSNKVVKLLETKQDKISFTPENSANKNKPGGYVGLDAFGKIPKSSYEVIIPPLDENIKRSFKVTNEEERLALTGLREYDRCYEYATGKEYVYMNSKWSILMDVSFLKTPKNNFTAVSPPMATDDIDLGYSVGSVWMNMNNGKVYICVNNEKGKALWQLIAGGDTFVNIGAIVPFKYESGLRPENTKDFQLPDAYDGTKEDYVEVSVDGIEKLQGKDYEIIEEPVGTFIIRFTNDITPEQTVFGEVYKYDASGINKDIMLKSEYDLNSDGKINQADMADYTKMLRTFETQKPYKVNEVILYNGIIYYSNSNFESGVAWDASKWNILSAKPIDLKDFTTNNLAEAYNKRYMTDKEKSDVATITSMTTNIENNKTEITGIKTDITKTKNENNIRFSSIESKLPKESSSTDQLVTNSKFKETLDALTIRALADVDDNFIANSYLRVSADGKRVEYAFKPVFPIKKITDTRGKPFDDVTELEFKGFAGDIFDPETGKLTLKPELLSTDFADFPKEHDHGKILISNGINKEYELVNAEALTLSKENYYITISASSWVEDSDGTYYYDIDHPLESMALIIQCVDTNNELDSNIKYKIFSNTKVRVRSVSRKFLRVTINCSLGVTNGYWSHAFDVNKIQIVDDTRPRVDKAYSSQYLETKMQGFANREEHYTKEESNIKYAVKSLEHDHANKRILDKFNEDLNGDVFYGGRKLLTDIKAKSFSDAKLGQISTSLAKIFDIENYMNLSQITALSASEVLIRNTNIPSGNAVSDANKKIRIRIMDGQITMIDGYLMPAEVQKYQLGISKSTTVYIHGNFDASMTITGF